MAATRSVLDLPELLHLIFSEDVLTGKDLVRCVQVNRRWFATASPRLWREADVKQLVHLIAHVAEDSPRFDIYRSLIREVDLETSEGDNKMFQSSVNLLTTKVEVLWNIECQPPDGDSNPLWCFCLSPTVTTAYMWFEGRQEQQLGHCSFCLDQLTLHCPELRLLELRGEFAYSSTLECLTPPLISPLGKPLLRCLYLNEVEIHAEITVEDLLEIARLPCLERFSFCIMHLKETAKKTWRNEVAAAGDSFFTKLTSLGIQAGLDAMADILPQFLGLSLATIEFTVWYEDLDDVSNTHPVWELMGQLRADRLAMFSMNLNCSHNVSSQALDHTVFPCVIDVVRNYPGLKGFYFECDNISSIEGQHVDLIAIALPHLKSLSIHRGYLDLDTPFEITTESLQALSDKCPNLYSISAGATCDFSALDDEAYANKVLFPRLNYIYLRGMSYKECRIPPTVHERGEFWVQMKSIKGQHRRHFPALSEDRYEEFWDYLPGRWDVRDGPLHPEKCPSATFAYGT